MKVVEWKYLLMGCGFFLFHCSRMYCQWVQEGYLTAVALWTEDWAVGPQHQRALPSLPQGSTMPRFVLSSSFYSPLPSGVLKENKKKLEGILEFEREREGSIVLGILLKCPEIFINSRKPFFFALQNSFWDNAYDWFHMKPPFEGNKKANILLISILNPDLAEII